jgi:hypothetical protein
MVAAVSRIDVHDDEYPTTHPHRHYEGIRMRCTECTLGPVGAWCVTEPLDPRCPGEAAFPPPEAERGVSLFFAFTHGASSYRDAAVGTTLSEGTDVTVVAINELETDGWAIGGSQLAPGTITLRIDAHGATTTATANGAVRRQYGAEVATFENVSVALP